MLQNHKIRNPFSLLDQHNSLLTIDPNNQHKQITQSKPIKKSSNTPFPKFKINHQNKNSKPTTVSSSGNTEKNNQQIVINQTKNNNQTLSSQFSSNLQQKKQSISQNLLQNKSLTNIFNSQSESIAQSQITEQDQQKKYFLTKKHRQIKYQLNSDGDPPLLYDIGLQPQMIKDKLKLVLKMGQPDYDMIMNPDLAGPVMIAFTFGFLLLFSGQIHFGDIYALFIMGNLCLFFLFNFMARKGVISLYNMMSILGYCLMPMLVLGLVGIFIRLNTSFGLIFSLVISLWSSSAGGNFIQVLIKGKKNRKILIVYPLFLFYASFAMIVIF